MNARKLDEFHLLVEQHIMELSDKFEELWMEGREYLFPMPPEEEDEEEEPVAGTA